MSRISDSLYTLAQSATYTISFDDTCITAQSGGNLFRLNYDKITDMDLKTNAEIQKAYVSSVGGAIVGGAPPLWTACRVLDKRKKERTARKLFVPFLRP